MQPLISICIPTSNRPGLLGEALESCFSQTYQDIEIVIGDDSRDGASGNLVAEYSRRYPGRIRYRRNEPPLGQNGNVDTLFARATGDRLVLLHDDDLLLPNALERLSLCWNQLPTLSAAFGKQYVVDHKGKVLIRESENLNAGYFRVGTNSGPQNFPVIAGISRMFPNDGFMVQTELARRTGYRTWQEVGDACDFDFGLRLCLAATHIWFIDEYLAKYRLSGSQLSKGASPAPDSYNILMEAQLPQHAHDARRAALKKLAPGAVSGLAKSGQPLKALRVLVSRNYALKDKLRLRAAYHAALIAKSVARKVGNVVASRSCGC